jgi:hypothetical protein
MVSVVDVGEADVVLDSERLVFVVATELVFVNDSTEELEVAVRAAVTV